MYRQLRLNYLPRYCWSFVSKFKFKFLMTSNSKKVLLNIAKYIYHAFNFRNTLLNF